MDLLYYAPMDRPWNQPLPRGRHHLTREQVSASQRTRILMAMIEEVADRGYAATSVAHITARAGVSRKSFYEQFDDKEDCYLAAFDAAAELRDSHLRHTVRRLEPDTDPVEVFRTGLRAFLEGVAHHPAASRTLLVEIYAVGRDALRRKDAMRRKEMAAVLGPLGFVDERGELTIEGEAIAGAIAWMVTQRVALGRFDELADLCDPVVDWVAQGLRGAAPTDAAHH
jgi:AcrR family transcriptional regulator